MLAGTGNINGTGNTLANALIGNSGDNVLNGGAGLDALTGGLGNDTYILEDGTDSVADTGGFDTLSSTITRTLVDFAVIDRLVLAGAADVNGTGNGLNNVLIGNSGRNSLFGGVGNDTVTGGLGRDALRGDAGQDDFDFNAVADSGTTVNTRDKIGDFVQGDDTIDLSTIDANGGAAGDAAFIFIPAEHAPFTGTAGELRWFLVDVGDDSLDSTIVVGDIDGDLAGDFQIGLTGLINLVAGDFNL